jgi:hypothetical protein
MPETPYLPAFGALDLNFFSIFFLFLKVAQSCNDNIPKKGSSRETRGFEVKQLHCSIWSIQ